MIWIILLGGMVQGAFAQNLEIKGMVRDARNKEILEFANVVLQTMDSSFVAGTTTDMKGHFLLNKIKKGSYILSVSSLGFKTEYISLEGLSKNISLGEISLNDDAVSLDGVTVSASAQTSHADKKVVFPSDRQMKASGNGMDLLQQMMLPRVQVDLLNSEIKATGNGVVQVRINGVKVEKGQAPRTPQDERLASRQPMLCKEDGALDFALSAEMVCNRTRGVTPWPGAFAVLDGQTYKLSAPYLADGSGAPGTILAADEKQGLVIACGEGAVGFGQIQAPGKKRMDARDFLRGRRLDMTKRFGK